MKDFNSRKLVATISAGSILALIGTLLTACTNAPEQDQRTITPYLREQADHFLQYIDPDSPQHAVLEDYYVTDQELQDSYNELLKCLEPHNITPGWDPSFTGRQMYGPDENTQDWYARDAENDQERDQAIERAITLYTECDLQYMSAILTVHDEQTKSQDGRDYYDRMRDKFVSCGFIEFTNLTNEEIRIMDMNLEIDIQGKYAQCYIEFITEEQG